MEKEVKRGELAYSQQGEYLIRCLENKHPNIRDAVNDWFVKEKLVIGPIHILEFMTKKMELGEL